MSARLCRYAAAIAALALATVLGAQAAALDTSGWPDAAAPREAPRLISLIDGCHGAGPDCARKAWLALLKSNNLAELAAPQGGRAYRMLWDAPGPVEWWQLTLNADGSGRIDASNGQTHAVTAEQTRAFETALANTAYATMPPDNSSYGTDGCPDDLLETVADGRYHFVRRGCSMEGIRAVTDPIDVLAGFPPPGSDPCGGWICSPPVKDK
jgi:hypothetical protein